MHWLHLSFKISLKHIRNSTAEFHVLQYVTVLHYYLMDIRERIYKYSTTRALNIYLMLTTLSLGNVNNYHTARKIL